jgi:DNA-binding XRE family transcriptional regulator
MNQYVTGAVIKRLREEKNMTQQQLADKLSVSAKTISKWETAKGYPDITLLESIANALSVSVTELISSNTIVNSNVSANMLRSHFYVCPVCGNIVHSMPKHISLASYGMQEKRDLHYLLLNRRRTEKR